jgi:hypothetical protein
MEQRKCGDLRLRRGGREYGRWRKENKEIKMKERRGGMSERRKRLSRRR